MLLLDGGINVPVFKNTLTEEQVIKLELNDRHIKAVLFVQEKE
jgi:hypothetical protein